MSLAARHARVRSYLAALALGLGTACTQSPGNPAPNRDEDPGSAEDANHGDGDGHAEHPGEDGPAHDGGHGSSDEEDAGPTAPPYSSPVPRPGAVFVHLFEWRWADIAEECERYLGPAGFEAVQISPPSEHLLLKSQGYPWWQRYQTVSYGLTESRSGTAAEFRDMVQRCARAGVGVYVDAVINHMTAKASGVGSAGSTFSKYEYAGLYSESDFHEPHCAIADADYTNNAHNVQECELLALSDLNTGKDEVQGKIADYLAGLVKLGVRGFRIDAAKHIAAADLRGIVSKVHAQVSEENAPFYYFEVFGFGGEVIGPEDYLPLAEVAGVGRASVIEFRYSLMGEKFRENGTISELADFANEKADFVPSERAIVFVNNHDTQRGDGLSYQDGKAFDLATITMLALPYGYPSLMSSYAFARDTERDKGPPSDHEGHTRAIYEDGETKPDCAKSLVPETGSWVCEHRRPYVPGMLAFRKATHGTKLANVWTNGKNQLAFSRGERGFVVINGESSELTRTFDTGLSAGEYCDAVEGTLEAHACTGRSIRVDENGRADLTISADSATAIHVAAKL
jgi:alpha-amylase